MKRNLRSLCHLGYGTFPYIIVRERSGIYRQIPIHFFPFSNKLDGLFLDGCHTKSTKEIRKNCVELLRSTIKKENNKPATNKQSKDSSLRTKEGCIVFNPYEAIYFDCEGKFICRSESIPSGGTLLRVDGEIIQYENRHFCI